MRRLAIILTIMAATVAATAQVRTVQFRIGAQVQTPTFSPAGGTYGSTQTVTIATLTPGATCYYTSDGTTPTTSSTQVTGSISVPTTQTLNTYCVHSGMLDSTVATATYTISTATLLNKASIQGFCTASAHGGATTANCNGTTGSSFTYTPNAASNDVLFLVSCAATTDPSPVTMTATGWTISQVGSTTGNATAGYVALFKAYSPNTSAATISTTWTAVPSNCGGFQNVLGVEVSGGNATNFIDGTPQLVQSAVSGTCAPSVTPSVDNTMVWFACNGAMTSAANSPYTAGANDTQGDMAQYQILTGGSGVAKTANISQTAGSYTGAGVVIKP